MDHLVHLPISLLIGYSSSSSPHQGAAAVACSHLLVGLGTNMLIIYNVFL